jgi:CheY-like chemotaxis protein
MKEANQVQQNLIADLQQKVSGIQIKIESPTSQQALSPQGDATSLPSNAKALLWVDDNPKNNSYFVQQLSDLGIRVDLAVSTADGISHFESKKYDYVISDMGRLDGESYSAETSYNATAGIDLLKYVRKRNREVPFVIFCSARAKKGYGQLALDSGASAVTSSPTELFGILNLAKAKNTA